MSKRCTVCFCCCVQGFYVVVDHHSYSERDPNMLNPALFAANWGNLWRTIAELPGYADNIKGRILPGE